MHFNRQVLRAMRSTIGRAVADQLTVGGYCGFLGNGKHDANWDDWPVAFTSLTGFASFWNVTRAQQFPTLLYGSIAKISPMQALALVIPGTNMSMGGPSFVTLYMAPDQVANWGYSCFQALGVNQCPNIGPVVPAAIALSLGVQYIAVMPDMGQVPCFLSCNVPSFLAWAAVYYLPM